MLVNACEYFHLFVCFIPHNLLLPQTLIGCGLAYYLYNEMGFRVLNRLDPVSAAVGNTVK